MSVKPRDVPDPSAAIDALISAIPDWRAETFARVRTIVRDTDPAIVEEFKYMGTPVWSCGGTIAVANAFKGRVNVTFAYGAHLPDPQKLFNAGFGGNERRAIELFENDTIDEDALRALVGAAIDYNRTHLKKNQKNTSGSRR